jgi:chemotaxis response regulator CheB
MKTVIDDNYYIVGIGASAGGQQALLEFLKNLPDEPNAAFVIVTHLSPDYKSQLDNILASASPIPVLRIKNNMGVNKNRVYVMPEAVTVNISEGRLMLKPRDQEINHAIDDFFISLARDQKNCAIGIIMSGSGFDGTSGVNEIHKYGGKVFVQTPDSATFSSMPTSVITKDHPDVIASPAMLAQHICSVQLT